MSRERPTTKTFTNTNGRTIYAECSGRNRFHDGENETYGEEKTNALYGNKFYHQHWLAKTWIYLTPYVIRMYSTNFWQPTVHVQQNISGKTIIEVGS